MQSDLFGAEFVHASTEDELAIGDVFVRVYNQQPNFALDVRVYITCVACIPCSLPNNSLPTCSTI